MSNPQFDPDEWIFMDHPELEGQTIRVHNGAAPVLQQSGWAISKDPIDRGMTREEFIDRFGYDPS